MHPNVELRGGPKRRIKFAKQMRRLGTSSEQANALERFVRTPAKTVCKDINQNLFCNAALSKTDDDILNCNRLKSRCTNNLPIQYNETFGTAKWKYRFNFLPPTARCRCGSCNHQSLLKQKTVRTLSAITNRAVRKNHMHKIKPNTMQVQVPFLVLPKSAVSST